MTGNRIVQTKKGIACAGDCILMYIDWNMVHAYRKWGDKTW